MPLTDTAATSSTPLGRGKRGPDKIPVGESRRQRVGSLDARLHLLHTALKLFSEKGFSKTSTREIALAAHANIASISYYFGDKAGLYRAAFTEPLSCTADVRVLCDQADLTLRESLQAFIDSFLTPMKQGELIQQCTRLHFREMVEPTGLWAEEIDNGIKPSHAALVALLGRHLKIAQADDAVHRLAFSITGLALQLFITRDVVQAICPQLLATPDAIDTWGEQMVVHAEAMIGLESARRAALVQPDVQPLVQSS